MARSGSFSGVGLDPFGAGGSSLSRYNMGETVSSLEALEAYTIALGWQNGTVSDDEYLASLKKQITLAVPGSREALSAKDHYDDAVYTISRNKIVLAVNAADTTAERSAALKRLIAHDEARLKVMKPDNEQRRELEQSIAGSRADIRQSEYGDLVEKVNAGKATTRQLLELAQRHFAAAGTDPDADEWQKAIGDLRDRIADEELTEAFQGYQHNRVTGEALLAKIDARLKDMTPGSAAHTQLKNQREDLSDNIKATERSKTLSTLQKDKNAGKITDAAYLEALRKDLESTEPGTNERIEAEDRLRQATFSLAEDKLRYEVQKGKKGAVDRLIKFYTSYRTTMVQGSAEWRALDLAISSLKGGVVRSGGGGGGGGGSSRGRSRGGSGGSKGLPSKVILPTGDLQGLAAQAGVPANVAKLLSEVPLSRADIKWFDNNRRALLDAMRNGDGQWLFTDKDGTITPLQFTPGMLRDIETRNVANLQYVVAHAKDPHARQVAAGKLLTALQSRRLHGNQISMQEYERTMKAINTEKQRALERSDFATYANLTFGQQTIIRDLLGIPEGADTDIALRTNMTLNDSAIARLTADIDAIEPQVTDPNAPDWHADGDPVMAAIDKASKGLPGIRLVDLDRDGVAETAVVDPLAGYVTQDTATGITHFVAIDSSNPEDMVPSALDPSKLVPAYTQTHVRVATADGAVWQPLVEGGGFSLPLYMTTGTKGEMSVAERTGRAMAGVPADVNRTNSPFEVVRTGAVVPGVRGVTVLEEGRDGRKRPVWWVTLDGVSFLRMEPGTGAATPSLVINDDVSSRAKIVDGALLIDGEAYKQSTHGDISRYVHFYGVDYYNSKNQLVQATEGKASNGMAGWGHGGQGTYFIVRKVGDKGGFLDGVVQHEEPDSANRAIWNARGGAGRSALLRSKDSSMYEIVDHPGWPRLRQRADYRAADPTVTRDPIRTQYYAGDITEPDDRRLWLRTAPYATQVPSGPTRLTPTSPNVNAQTGFVLKPPPTLDGIEIKDPIRTIQPALKPAVKPTASNVQKATRATLREDQAPPRTIKPAGPVVNAATGFVVKPPKVTPPKPNKPKAKPKKPKKPAASNVAKATRATAREDQAPAVPYSGPLGR